MCDYPYNALPTTTYKDLVERADRLHASSISICSQQSIKCKNVTRGVQSFRALSPSNGRQQPLTLKVQAEKRREYTPETINSRQHHRHKATKLPMCKKTCCFRWPRCHQAYSSALLKPAVISVVAQQFFRLLKPVRRRGPNLRLVLARPNMVRPETFRNLLSNGQDAVSNLPY